MGPRLLRLSWRLDTAYVASQSKLLGNLWKIAGSPSAKFTNLAEDQDAVNRVWNEFFGQHIPCITTVQITRLGTDPRLRLEIAAIAVVPE